MRRRFALSAHVLLAAGAAVTVAGCSLSSHHASPSTTTSLTSSTPGVAAGSVAARAFAGAYVRFLRGELEASALPDATSAARRTATLAGRLPAHAHRAQLQLTATREQAGGSWVVTMRDGAHRLNATLTVAHETLGWRVTALVPPDFSTQLQPVARAARPRLPVGASAPAHAAEVFLRAYLPFEYGHQQLRNLRDLTTSLRAYLRRNTPRLVAPLHPRILAFTIHRAGAAWVATPSVSDGVNTYQVTVTLVRQDGRWLANSVPPPNYSAKPAPGGALPPSTSTSTSSEQLVRAQAGVVDAACATRPGEGVAGVE